MLVPVEVAGMVEVDLLLMALLMMIVEVEAVQVLLGTLKLNNMFQLVIQFPPIII
jgi:hypothetical protein